MAATGTTATPAKKTAPAAAPKPTQTETPAESTQIRDTNVSVAKTKFDAETLTAIKMAPAWRHNETGDAITGTVVAILKREHAEYGAYPLVILNTSDDPATKTFVSVHAFHGVLLNEMRELKTKPGDKVTVTYTGKRQANKLNSDGSGRNYHGYSVVPAAGAEVETFSF